MTLRSYPALICLLTLMLTAAGAFGQAPPPPPSAVEEELVEPTSIIKKVSLSFHGGYYSGATYFDLPMLDSRAQLQEGTHYIMMFTGEENSLGTEQPTASDFYSLAAPFEKKLDSGNFYSARVGFYLSDSIHIDIFGSYTTASASIHVTEYRFGQDIGLVTFENDPGYKDEDFKVYMGGLNLLYDAYEVERFGLTPYFGFGFGGIINRFSVLEDKGALYFNLIGGFAYHLTDNLRLEAQASTSTYAFTTEEVEYDSQVVSSNLSMGVTWLFDVKPVYNR